MQQKQTNKTQHRSMCVCLQVGLTLVSVVSKLAYSYDLGAWSFLEGMMSARNHPNIIFWNITRFNPFYCLLEVGSGIELDLMTETEAADVCRLCLPACLGAFCVG